MEMQQYQMNKADVTQALKHDSPFFLQFFLGEHMECESPKFHYTAFNFMLDSSVSQLALAIPRDHAKTTLAKLAVVWYLLFTDHRFAVYVSSTLENAINALTDIVAFIESDNFVEVFGKVEFITNRPGEGTYKFRLNGKTCMLKALSANQKVRGLNIDNQRPDLCICDDIEDYDNIATPPAFKKLRKWVRGSLFKALTRNAKKIWLGNMINYQSMLKQHCDSQYWSSMLFGCFDENMKPIWEDKFSELALRDEFREFLEAGDIDVWLAEMMNMPVNLDTAMINAEQIKFSAPPIPSSVDYAFITLDPAISKEDSADSVALVVHAYSSEIGRWVPVEYLERKGMDPYEMWLWIHEMGDKWNVNVVSIETIAFQAVLLTLFSHYDRMRNKTPFEYVGVASRASKTSRIAAWCGLLKSGEYGLLHNDFAITSQLLAYDPTKKNNVDDLIDSCAQGPLIINKYLHLIVKERGWNAKDRVRRTLRSGATLPVEGVEACKI